MIETVTPSTNPMRSPTYPQRVHIRERAQWQALLETWEKRLIGAQTSIVEHPDRARLLAQMAGARDQIADAVGRLPMEVGDMYEEDKHRVENAVAAFERLFARWDSFA